MKAEFVINEYISKGKLARKNGFLVTINSERLVINLIIKKLYESQKDYKNKLHGCMSMRILFEAVKPEFMKIANSTMLSEKKIYALNIMTFNKYLYKLNDVFIDIRCELKHHVQNEGCVYKVSLNKTGKMLAEALQNEHVQNPQ